MFNWAHSHNALTQNKVIAYCLFSIDFPKYHSLYQQQPEASSCPFDSLFGKQSDPSPTRRASNRTQQEKPLQCHLCGEGYVYQGWLTKHLQEIHGTPSLAGNRSDTSSTRGVSTSAQKEKPVTSTFRKQSDPSPTRRESNSNSDTSSSRGVSISAQPEKPLQCHLCGKCYVYQGWLTRHLQEVHGTPSLAGIRSAPSSTPRTSNNSQQGRYWQDSPGSSQSLRNVVCDSL